MWAPRPGWLSGPVISRLWASHLQCGVGVSVPDYRWGSKSSGRLGESPSTPEQDPRWAAVFTRSVNNPLRLRPHFLIGLPAVPVCLGQRFPARGAFSAHTKRPGTDQGKLVILFTLSYLRPKVTRLIRSGLKFWLTLVSSTACAYIISPQLHSWRFVCNYKNKVSEYGMTSLTWGIWKEMIQTNLQNRKILRLESEPTVGGGKRQRGSLGRSCTHCCV